MSDPTEITPGTVVKLKSGGPRMTVGTVDDDMCFVQWFDERNEYHEQEDVPLASLRVVPDGEAA